MKIQTKKTVALALCVVFAVLAVASTVAAVILITGNTLNFNPVAKPVLVLTSNSTSTPYVGDTIALTATLSPVQAGVTVSFYINQVVAGSAVTNAQGVAVFDYLVSSVTPLAVYPTAQV